jgi:hypothetical protein
MLGIDAFLAAAQAGGRTLGVKLVDDVAHSWQLR